MASATGDASELITRVQNGMTVRDTAGDKVGKVNLIQLGDPEAANAAREHAALGKGLIVEEFSRGYGTGGEPHVPDALRPRMLESGYIRIDGGLFSRTRYAIADQIDCIEGDVVHLRATKHDLATTHMTE
jgi:hypothetical protein